ncbi:hypothetical protein AB1N83_005445, partial [Pleurotus pulmonarius]
DFRARSYRSGGLVYPREWQSGRAYHHVGILVGRCVAMR